MNKHSKGISIKLVLAKFGSLSLLLSTLFLFATTSQASTNNLTNTKVFTAGQKLHALLDSDWQRYLKNNPEIASYLGDKRYNQSWEDKSLDAILIRHQQNLAVLEDLKTINYQALSDSDKINYDLFKWQIQSNIDEFNFSPYLMPINQMMGSVQSIDAFADFFSFASVQDYQDWLVRLQQLPELINQTISLMNEGMKRGVVPPKIIISRIPAHIEKHLVDNPKDSLFFNKF